MGNRYPSKGPAPPPTFTRAQLEAGERLSPGEKQPFGYNFYKHPWLGGASYFLGLAAGGPQKAKLDDQRRKRYEAEVQAERIQAIEQRIRMDQDKLNRIENLKLKELERQCPPANRAIQTTPNVQGETDAI